MSRLAKRAYIIGDELPAVGETVLVAGSNTDITCDQDRKYTEMLIVAYTPDRFFVCLQAKNCWPVVEKLTNCWFAS